ncbi:cache domain-containing sensor histidine kinase [Paenibacillus naphthalenovorans]|uniref:cache domain-containing sensor histidine kinase n=1 Tax=Paenibacillus naphthalenovorans TaxID=162209 RepID=UPI000884957B|nr:sensor histidine kinase [Paenibacillus naphthalenovorans]SDI82159.1 two-component system, sensor histidine kinase YesM [Paenibacillus naphthalenovorans]
MGRILHFFRKSIKRRLLFCFVWISILPIVIVGFIPYQKTAEVVKGQVLEYAQITVNQLNENINYHLNEMDLMSRMVYYQVFAAFEKEGGESEIHREDFRQFILALKNNRTFIDEIHVIEGDQYYSTASVLRQELLKSKDWYISSLQNPGEKTWVGPHVNDYSLNEPKTDRVVSLVYPFILPKRSSPAVIIIEMKQDKLDELFQSPALRSLGKVLLIDKYGRILYSSDPSLLPAEHEYSNQYITNTNLLGGLNDEYSFIYDINYFSGWKVAAFIPNVKIEQSFASIRKIVFMLIGIFLVISILLGWGLSDRLIKPLRTLQIDMRQVKKGKFYTRSAIDADDEIGDLSRNFNQMVAEIESLIDKISESERKKKQIEMQSLQYQINPHFLYNTLNSVQWLAKEYKAPEISEMLTALIKLLRASLNTTNYTHMLEEELEVLSYYARIQKYRYDDQVKIIYRIDTDVLAALVPRFVLQPLVENAFFHGLSDNEGRIEISARRKEDLVEIVVEDNGRGIDADKLKTLFSPDVERKHSSGIGIKNVDDKIKHYFGDSYGLSIDSVKGRGTRISIVLPCRLKEGVEELDDTNLSG